MFPGQKFMLGDREVILPPLSLGQLRNGLGAKMDQHDSRVMEGKLDNELMFLRVEIIIAALRRNYSETDLPDSEIWDKLDYGNLLPAWRAVLGLSGLDAEGEAEAARVDGMMSGGSIPPSPPGTDGQSTTLTN